MSTPVLAETFFFLVGMYMVISYISNGNLFRPHHVKGRMVVVTDATSTVGRQMALEYAKMNAKLFLSGSNTSFLADLQYNCLKLGADDADFVSGGEVSDAEFRRRIVSAAEQRYGGIDHLILAVDSQLEMATRPWNDSAYVRKAVDDYVMASAHMAQLAMTSLKRNRGYIGLVSTMPGKVSLPHLAAVSAAKTALHTYFAALRQQLKRGDGYVSVTSVTLGYVDGLDGVNEQGRWSELFGGYGKPSLSNAAWWAMFYIGGRKKEVTYPFVAQCQSAIHSWFPSIYENPKMPSFAGLIPPFPLISS